MTILEQARAIRAAMDVAGAAIDDGTAADCAALFPLWCADKHYTAGERVRYGDKLYRCLLDHDAQSDWTPDAAPSLWVRIDDPAIDWPAWVQPAGAHDAYVKGAKVAHIGKHWISKINANTYEPGSSGIGSNIWEEQPA